ncbi:unnamed protein product [Toxocara canis]|uniref:Glycoprotein endo-alpha-1,2-mannosidase-like protein n=1 Tax=Toxocara canis TaxID=6265 RepID=A0A183U3L5_TOXCA|nr:unnamed protein product [Toxocara canis]
MPHWNKEISKKYPQGHHMPPPDIASSFYPKLGPYSSRDPAVIEQHMKWISSCGVDVIVVSWYHPGMADKSGHSWDDLIPILLDAAEKHRMKMTFHMEPYDGRNASTLRRDIDYIIKTYGTHPALYRRMQSASKAGVKGEPLPLLYFYDSYLVESKEWKMLTTPSGKMSVRGTAYDVIFMGLLVQSDDRYTLTEAGFDGIYTYFASEGFSYGSTPSNWPSLTTFCRFLFSLFFLWMRGVFGACWTKRRLGRERKSETPSNYLSNFAPHLFLLYCTNFSISNSFYAVLSSLFSIDGYTQFCVPTFIFYVQG